MARVAVASLMSAQANVTLVRTACVWLNEKAVGKRAAHGASTLRWLFRCDARLLAFRQQGRAFAFLPAFEPEFHRLQIVWFRVLPHLLCT